MKKEAVKVAEDRKELEDGQVEVTVVNRMPRYEATAHYASYCDSIIADMKEAHKIWTTKHNREGFESLNTDEDWEPEGNSFQDDLASFQQYLDKTYGAGQYEAYGLGAYVHGAVSFSISKGPDCRCRWDSGTIGFIGMNKTINMDVADINKAARILSDAWNGWVVSFGVYDNLTQDWVDFCDSIDDNLEDWKKSTAEEYHISWDNVEPEC